MASPITVQTNNPGAITDGSWARGQPGYTGANGDFAVFDTPDSGRAAQLKLLNNYASSGHNTISSIINKWAPQAANSPGSTGNYAAYVAQRTGLDPNAPLTPDQLGSVATAQQEWESGLKKNGFAPPASAAVPDTSKALDDIFGTPAAPAAASPETVQPLDSIFGPDTNAFGTTSKPGTPQFAADAVAYQKTGKPAPVPASGAPPEWQPPDFVPAPVRAFVVHSAQSVPVLGAAYENAMNANPLTASQDVAADRNAPWAATAGNVFGTVAPFMLVGPEGAISKALGIAGDYGLGTLGNIGARTLAGGISGAGIAGADTAARGGDANQIGQNMLTGGVIGAVAAPAAHAVGDLVGKGVNAFFGKSAPQALADAMHEDQQAPGQINQLIQNLGPKGTAADLGPNTESLAGGLASLPGKPKAIVINNLTGRAAGAGDRLNADVAANLGVGQPVGALTDQITAQQKAAADPLYAAVRPQSVQMTPALQALSNTPLGKQAFETAAKMMANDGLSGKGTTVGFFDAAKQALDDITSSKLRAGENNAARQSTSMANTITSEVDQQVPQYAAARNAFAGPARVKDAIEQGQSAFSKTTTPEDMARQLAGLSPSERDGFLAGAQDAVQNIMHNARNDAQGAKTAFQSVNAKEKLAALVGPDASQAISDALDREATYAATTGNAVHNSKSAARLAQQRVLSPDTAAIPNPRPTLLGLVSGAFNMTRNALTGGYRAGQNAKLANMLTSGLLSPSDAAAVARAGAPSGTRLPAGAVPLLAKQNNVGVPGGNPFLQWASPSNMLTAPGIGGPATKIIVRGATPLPAGALDPGRPF